eukprot:6185781-Pleurochrysis_carterae.AAC.1
MVAWARSADSPRLGSTPWFASRLGSKPRFGTSRNELLHRIYTAVRTLALKPSFGDESYEGNVFLFCGRTFSGMVQELQQHF